LLGPVAALLLLTPAAFAAPPLSFNRDIRPILSDKCYLCHGPDAGNRNIPLRLDSEGAARRAIVPGKPEQSLLIARISAEKPALRMPPVHSGLKLSAGEIEMLRHWIAQGAQWEKHWSFLPPKRPEPPAVRNTTWVRNPIDRFVLARLEKEGLQPSADASRTTLLRRATLDLTGLPPTPAEVDAFLKDPSPKAYEKALDRLLASPRYGERMAAPWLDAARYADSNGYQYDGERVMWRWRDWVIEAFNRNQPYNQFVLEQIAGDMLPNATMEQVMATAFNRNHRGNTEDGIIPEEYRIEYVVDRVETTSTVFLGLTLGCARCHNHKYDPFTQKEFYRIFAYFNNVPELGRAMKYGNSPPLIPAPTKAQQDQLASLNQQINALKQRLASQESLIVAGQQEWERKLAEKAPLFWNINSGLETWFPFDHAANATPGLRGNAGLFDGANSADFAGAAPYDIDDAFSLAAWIRPDADTGAVFSRMADTPRGKGIGLYLKQGKLHFHLTSNYDDDVIRIDAKQRIPSGGWHHVAVTYDGSVSAAGVKLYLDGRPVETTVDQETLYRPFRNAGRPFREPLRIGAGGGKENRFRGAIDEVVSYSRTLSAEEIAVLAIPASLNEVASRRQRSAAEQLLLRWRYLESSTDWAALQQLERDRERLQRTFPTVMVMAEMDSRRATHVLQRGAYDKPGEKVEPGVPEALHPFPAGAPNNRLGFAQWLVSEANPLTARVAVNRFWQMYFGTGLVKTVEDFGVQGEWPSHPELLDWLATEFMRTGWDVKAMQKLILSSATYRQSSRATPELAQRDPDNRLLARGPRFRMPAEMIRDQALYAAGLLNERLGGPSVKPYQPEGLWAELTMQDSDYVRARGPDLYRRGLYTFWKRTVAPPMMVNFDSATRESCVVVESRTNTPLQALNLMNDVTFLESARQIATRMFREAGKDADSRLAHGFLLITGRRPEKAELAVLRQSLNYHLDYFATDAARAAKYLAQGDSPVEANLNQAELAAYASVASLLLNMDEAVTKE
jgi:hypothetical protein